MSSFFKRAQRGFAKAVQKSGVEGILTELPNCEPLCHMEVLSIRLESDEQRDAAIMEHVLNQEFAPINFLIRNEKSGKRTVMNAELICNQGFRVQQQGSGQDVMMVTLPSHSSDSIGKIVHPSGATIYKVYSNGPQSYRVQRAASAVGGALPPCVIRIEKVLVSLYPLAKMMGFIGTSCVYWFKDCDGRVLGYVRPKLVMRKNTLILKFMTDRGNAQVRGAMLGSALLFVLHEAYPELSRLLRESMHDT
uniref:Uncharacterized protein n=1 Tax=Plectus sambesii TaxID=2011161 RepID=A0A914XJ72_9BILA